jgi:hypothetical protein
MTNKTIDKKEVLEKDLRQLAACTILQAFHDAQNADEPERRLDAVLWLASEDAAWWCEWAGMPFADVAKVLSSGRARKAKTRQNYGRGANVKIQRIEAV